MGGGEAGAERATAPRRSALKRPRQREDTPAAKRARRVVQFPRRGIARCIGHADRGVDRSAWDLPFSCDRCGAWILELRWHCAVCEDFDLCGACHAALKRGDADAAHVHPASAFSEAPPGLADAEEAGAVEAEAQRQPPEPPEGEP